MGETLTYTFPYKEVAEALVKKQDVHDGIWQLYIEFGIGAANMPSAPDQATLMPAAIVPIVKIGIMKVDKETNLAVDAAKVNPMKT